MKRQTWLSGFLSWWVVGGAVALAVVVLVGLWFGGRMLRPAAPIPPTQVPVVKVVQAPTLTPVIQVPTQAATITPSPAASGTAGAPTPLPPPANTAIKKDLYVQVSGTGGEGLRLRAGAGVNAEPRLLGHEAEVFQVKDGPKDVDGYTWWYLVSPSDPARSGWAVSNYLAVIQNP